MAAICYDMCRPASGAPSKAQQSAYTTPQLCGTLNLTLGDTRRACLASETLRQYEGPTCFAIPGNHDWIDGLETFQRHIHHKGWLGGWLLPQVLS